MAEKLTMRVPTHYQQAQFCRETSRSDGRPNEANFLAQGFRLEPLEPTLEDLKIYMYLPRSFPTPREASIFDWATLPEEVPIGFVVQVVHCSVYRDGCCAMVDPVSGVSRHAAP